MRQAGATLHRGARASHCRGLSCCGAQAPDAQAQQLWLTGPAAPWHVGSSQTRARTRVLCIGRQLLNHCATRQALELFLRGLGLFLFFLFLFFFFFRDFNYSMFPVFQWRDTGVKARASSHRVYNLGREQERYHIKETNNSRR